ncbi:MAG TPA: hypothetical protein VN047_01515 [Sphingopyxis sp.]|nr:hypothetical protein [Sphingopyxis sp.]HWW55549.1 hypothetical protein [Sphingopyxis sp.]
MAKSQKRSNREIRKPKAAKAKPPTGLAAKEGSAVKLTAKPKDNG